MGALRDPNIHYHSSLNELFVQLYRGFCTPEAVTHPTDPQIETKLGRADPGDGKEAVGASGTHHKGDGPAKGARRGTRKKEKVVVVERKPKGAGKKAVKRRGRTEQLSRQLAALNIAQAQGLS